MSYTKHIWKDYESGGTPITAQTLNEMESGIEAAHTQIASTDKKVATNEQNIQALSTNVSAATTNITALQQDMSKAQSDIQTLSSTVNDIPGTYAKKVDVPKLVKVDGTTVFLSEDGILSGATSVDVDTSLSTSSLNPIANSAVTTAINAVKTDLQDKADTDVVPNLVKVDGTTITKASDGTLSAIGGGGGGTIVLPIDDTLSETSTNAVQNKVITKALQEKAGTNDITTLNRTVTELQENKADKTEVPKLVKVDGTTITMDDATKIIKIAQTLQTKINSIDTKLAKANVVNNLVTTEEGYALDARQGQALNGMIDAINNSLANINILYKYDDTTLICKQGHVITIYFDCIENGIAKLQDYLTKHPEYCPFKNTFVVAPVWKNGENAKYIGYLYIDTQGLIYLKYMPSAYPSTFANFPTNYGISGSISYVV